MYAGFSLLEIALFTFSKNDAFTANGFSPVLELTVSATISATLSFVPSKKGSI